MNKLELVDHVARQADITKASAAAAVDAMIEGVTQALAAGEEVRLVGFGAFSVAERAATMGRNPATGEQMPIAASRNARFKPSASLKSVLNAGK